MSVVLALNIRLARDIRCGQGCLTAGRVHAVHTTSVHLVHVCRVLRRPFHLLRETAKKKVTVSKIIISPSLEFRSMDLSPDTDNNFRQILDKFWNEHFVLAFVRENGLGNYTISIELFDRLLSKSRVEFSISTETFRLFACDEQYKS